MWDQPSFGTAATRRRADGSCTAGFTATCSAQPWAVSAWPVFGSANQLIAAMVLIIATLYLMSKGRAWLFTAVPAVLVFATAMGALIYSLLSFVGVISVQSLPRSNLLAAVAAVLIVLGFFIAYRSGAVLRYAALKGVAAAAANATRRGPSEPTGEGPDC